MKIISNSADQTFAYGERLADLLKPGDIIALFGELGTGKTVLTKGLASGLGIKKLITSPTFTIIREYSGRLPLFHFDVYRIDSDELKDLGYEDYFFSKGITIIEWAENIKDLLPSDYLAIKIMYGEKEEDRIIEFQTLGNFKERLRQIKKIVK